MSQTVLIVDDAYFMRNLIKKALKEDGYEVIGEAKNGKEGIKLYFELRPDIVTMDINMPDITGIEATREIISKDSHAKIIAVTGNNDEEIKREMLEAGAKEYLQKPFQPAFLLNKLEKMMAKTEDTLLEHVQEEDIVVEETPQKTPAFVMAESVEDDFDDFDDMTMEIEIMDKPDESKSMTFEIENEEDSIEFPEEYKEVVKEELEGFRLSKENLEKAEKEEYFLEDSPEVPELTQDELLIDIQSEPSPSLPIQEEPIIKRPVVEAPAPTHPVAPQKPIPKPPTYPTVPQPPKAVREAEKSVASPPKKESLVSTVEITTSKKTDRKMEETTIRPQGNPSSFNSNRGVDIRPPRGKVLRAENTKLDETDIEEPILNVSEKDKYNDKNDGLLSVVKKLFKSKKN